MSVVLYHHPFSRASTVVWMLEEVGVDYELRFVDLKTGQHKAGDVKDHNPMGKIPLLLDGEVVVTETAAIGLYLADRYAPGRLAPALDDDARGPYLRWSLFPPSVIEPAAMAASSNWAYEASSAGFGSYADMLDAAESAIGDGPYLLGDNFSMADVIFGATLRFMLRFKMLEERSTFTEYVDRLSSRPASQAADARNLEVMKAHGIAPR